jgi:hypothetical protein
LEDRTGHLRDIWNDGVEWNEQLWRYFKVERFAWTLANSKLYFAASTQFADIFEGAAALLPPDFPVDPRYQEMSMEEQAYFGFRCLHKISCWHRADYESDAMWRLYAAESKGVAICSTPERLRAAIAPYSVFPTSKPEDLWGGPVKYHDFLKVRLKPHGRERYFSKHQAFSWEREFRLLISLMEADEFCAGVPRGGVEVAVDLDLLVERIMLGPKLTDAEMDVIIEEARKMGLGGRICKSSLLGAPKFL